MSIEKFNYFSSVTKLNSFIGLQEPRMVMLHPFQQFLDRLAEQLQPTQPAQVRPNVGGIQPLLSRGDLEMIQQLIRQGLKQQTIHSPFDPLRAVRA